MHFSRIWCVTACSIVAAALSGCGGADEKVKHPDVVPAAGVVTYKDAPVTKATVVLLSADGKKNGWGFTGETDASGRFEVTSTFSPTTQVKGVPAGDYTVIVTKLDSMNPDEYKAKKKELDEKAQKAMTGVDPSSPELKNKSLVPEKYGAEATSGLQVKIESGGNKNIELKLID